jgi:hypothetical protein
VAGGAQDIVRLERVERALARAALLIAIHVAVYDQSGSVT